MAPYLVDALWNIELPVNQKLALLALARKANDIGFCHARAAGASLQQTGLGVKQIEEALAELVKKGRLAALTMSIGEPYSYVIVLDDLPAGGQWNGGAR